MNEPIITSLLDTDLYKITMLYAIWKNGHNKEATFEFKNRNREPFTVEMVDEIMDEIAVWRMLTFKEDELDYLRELNLFEDEKFFDFLRDLRLTNVCPVISVDGDMGLNIRFTGPWQETILFEVPVLAIVNEVYFRHQDKAGFRGVVNLGNKLKEYNKINLINRDLKISEFGTRRRYSKAWQETVVREMVTRNNGWLVGTSNVNLARKFGITPIGTMAHEYLMAYQVIEPNLAFHIPRALVDWNKVYGTKLAVALTDSITSEIFIQTTNMFQQFGWDKLTGFRHDSGDAIEWANKITSNQHYGGQTLLFSDGLNPAEVKRIWYTLGARFPIAFGVGTDFTNDVGLKALNIVLKMIEYDGQPVSKISDEPAKSIGANANEIKEFFCLG